MPMVVETRAYVGAVGAPDDGRWNAHTEPMPVVGRYGPCAWTRRSIGPQRPRPRR